MYPELTAPKREYLDRTILSDHTKYGIWSLCVVLFQMFRAYSAVGEEGKAWTRKGTWNHSGTICREAWRISENHIPLGNREQHAGYQPAL